MIGQRTQLSNMIRGLLGEFGCIVAKGLNHITALAEVIEIGDGPALPETVQGVITSLCEQLLGLHHRIKTLDKKIFTASRKDQRVRLLETILGIGPITASAIVAMANKTARIVWAVLTRGQPYKQPVAV